MVLLLVSPALLAGYPGSFLVAGVTALVAAVAVLPWSPGRVGTASAVAACSSLALDIGYTGPHQTLLAWSPFGIGALLALLVRVVRSAPVRQVVAVGALLVVALSAVPAGIILRIPGHTVEQMALMCLLISFPTMLAAAVGWYLRSSDNRWVAAIQQARREQRLEVARNLHDFVAHEVTGMVLEVQAARIGELDREQLGGLLARLDDAGRRALDLMDDTLQALRDPTDPTERAARQPPGLADLPELIDRFAVGGGTGAELDLDRELVNVVPSPVSTTAYHVVLEALTNVRRHAARATAVVVRVARANDRVLEVSITDDGARSLPPASRHSGGSGLINLRERVSAIGGTVTAGPDGSGWHVTATLPLPSRARRR